MPSDPAARDGQNGWRWKQKGATPDGGGLLYEPGNWGDVLKGLWVLHTTDWFLRHGCRTRFAFCDPFAGAPDYPLPPTAARRLERLGNHLPAVTTAAHRAQMRWPSSSRLVLDRLAAEGATAPVQVYDRDPTRRQQWAAVEGATVLTGEDGYDIAHNALPPPEGLLLLDPYDFLSVWERELPRLIAWRQRTTVLLYLYNRAGRSREQLRAYRAFRNALDRQCEAQIYLLGRLPADSFLPDTHHEMLLLPAPSIAQNEAFGQLRLNLNRDTVRLHRRQAEYGVFEP